MCVTVRVLVEGEGDKLMMVLKQPTQALLVLAHAAEAGTNTQQHMAVQHCSTHVDHE